MVSDAIFPYHRGGKETRYRYIIDGLVAAGHDVTVYTMRWWPGDGNRRVGGVAYRAICDHRPLYHGGRRSITQALIFALACFRVIGFSGDVIEADHMPYLQLLPLRLVAWVRRVPIVVTWHEYWGPETWKEYLGSAGRIAAVVERLASRLPDHIICVSPGTEQRLSTVGGVAPGRLSTVIAGVDLAEISAVRPRHGFDVLFAGRLIDHKHCDLLVTALALLRDRGQEVTMGIVGVGPEEQALRHQVSGLDLCAQVVFLGHLPEATDLFALMKGSRVFALPSSREGFGIVAVEALACGTPVLTVGHPDNHAQWLIDRGVNGWVVELTAESLAAGIQEALATPIAAAACQEGIGDWGRTAERSAAVYRAVVTRA